MEKKRLGKLGPCVSRIGFGAWAIGGVNWGPVSDEDSKTALRRAVEGGVNFIDTADVYGYGHSESLIAQVLDEMGTEEVIVATKAGNDFYSATEADDTGYGPIRLNGDSDYLVYAAEQSLRRLRTEVLDILQLHSLETWQLEREGPWKALQKLKKDGKIRYAGWSVKSFQENEQVRFLGEYQELIDCIQVRYNLLERQPEEQLLPRAQELGIGVIVRIPLLFGLLTGKFDRGSRFDADDHRSFNLSPEKLTEHLARLEQMESFFRAFPEQTRTQVSLRFCLSHPACSVVIPGAKYAWQVDENCHPSVLEPLPPGSIPTLDA